MLAAKFIENELTAYTKAHGLSELHEIVALITKAFEAYDEYRRLVSVKGRPFTEMDYKVRY